MSQCSGLMWGDTTNDCSYEYYRWMCWESRKAGSLHDIGTCPAIYLFTAMLIQVTTGTYYTCPCIQDWKNTISATFLQLVACACSTCEGVWRHIEHSGWEVVQTIGSDVELPQITEVTNPCRELYQTAWEGACISISTSTAVWAYYNKYCIESDPRTWCANVCLTRSYHTWHGVRISETLHCGVH